MVLVLEVRILEVFHFLSWSPLKLPHNEGILFEGNLPIVIRVDFLNNSEDYRG